MNDKEIAEFVQKVELLVDEINSNLDNFSGDSELPLVSCPGCGKGTRNYWRVRKVYLHCEHCDEYIRVS